MDFDYLISLLDHKDTSQAFQALKELELISDDSDILYPFMDKFIEMIGSEKYVIRVRGFRLYCRQAKWDVDNKVNLTIETALNILNDEKPTAVRQALAALNYLVPYKKELINTVKEKVASIDYLRYRDTMHSLIAKDIQCLQSTIVKNSN